MIRSQLFYKDHFY